MLKYNEKGEIVAIICNRCGVDRFPKGLRFGYCPDCREKYPIPKQIQERIIFHALKRLTEGQNVVLDYKEVKDGIEMRKVEVFR